MNKKVVLTVASVMILSAIIAVYNTSLSPIISSKLAVSQLADSDESFVAMQMFESQKWMVPSVLIAAIVASNVWLWWPRSKGK